jgi:neutral ceramidase
VPLRLGVLGIGDVALTSVDAEVYALISQRLKRQSPMANTVVVTLANGAAPSGYIPDDASFSHNSFQVLGSRLKPGCAEDAIADGLTNMVTQFQKPQP